MTLDNLMAYVQPACAAVRRRYASINPAEGEAVLNLVGMGITHLDVARFGAKLYTLPHSADEALKRLFFALRARHETLEYAAKNLVFRGVVSTLDVGAAALWRLLGGAARSNGHEADVRYWQDSKDGKALRASGDPDFVQWIELLLKRHEWTILREGRDLLTHRTQGRHVVTGSDSATSGPEPARSGYDRITLAGHTYDLPSLFPALVTFGTESWKDVCDRLVRHA